ncbi:MAG TPA: NAD(P)-dependent methylenetetrahydromethanopterin dehydrogenase [Planctomycetota bacterium]|nr:NAD(P)-dependent methylenetetrahydromethanopterin dehydrogenase [Planctomycetota bacterium]
MSEKRKILIQLDSDAQPSVFDRIVAVDAGADVVFSCGGIAPPAVRDLVYGAVFTRGGEDLRRTAIFIGGSDVSAGEEILSAVKRTFFGSFRVSVLLDSNGANTTAAAAVVLAARHVALEGARALVLASTGPVGRRVARLLVRQGAVVLVASRSLDRAQGVAAAVQAAVNGASVLPVSTEDAPRLAAALEGVDLVVAAGGPGALLLPMDVRRAAKSLRLVIDLNAVPPEGIEGVKGGDFAKEREGVVAYGALGVGGIKMKIHRAAVARLFEANDLVLDVEECFERGQGL